MKKVYDSPVLLVQNLISLEEILTASEENADISVGFDTLWGV